MYRKVSGKTLFCSLCYVKAIMKGGHSRKGRTRREVKAELEGWPKRRKERIEEGGLRGEGKDDLMTYLWRERGGVDQERRVLSGARGGTGRQCFPEKRKEKGYKENSKVLS